MNSSKKQGWENDSVGKLLAAHEGLSSVSYVNAKCDIAHL